MQPRNPPNFSKTQYNATVLYDANIRYDGIIINYPNWDDRTQPTTTYTTRPSITGFISYTWDNAPDTWAGVTANWDNYGTISTGTSYTTRITPA